MPEALPPSSKEPTKGKLAKTWDWLKAIRSGKKTKEEALENQDFNMPNMRRIYEVLSLGLEVQSTLQDKYLRDSRDEDNERYIVAVTKGESNDYFVVRLGFLSRKTHFKPTQGSHHKSDFEDEDKKLILERWKGAPKVAFKYNFEVEKLWKEELQDKERTIVDSWSLDFGWWDIYPDKGDDKARIIDTESFRSKLHPSAISDTKAHPSDYRYVLMPREGEGSEYFKKFWDNFADSTFDPEATNKYSKDFAEAQFPFGRTVNIKPARSSIQSLQLGGGSKPNNF